MLVCVHGFICLFSVADRCRVVLLDHVLEDFWVVLHVGADLGVLFAGFYVLLVSELPHVLILCTDPRDEHIGFLQVYLFFTEELFEDDQVLSMIVDLITSGAIASTSCVTAKLIFLRVSELKCTICRGWKIWRGNLTCVFTDLAPSFLTLTVRSMRHSVSIIGLKRLWICSISFLSRGHRRCYNVERKGITACQLPLLQAFFIRTLIRQTSRIRNCLKLASRKALIRVIKSWYSLHRSKLVIPVMMVIL